ncbi:MAG: hypothetical protein ACKOQ4_03105, partial [Mycobacterium sp.]
VVDAAGWRAIDGAEVARGTETGRPRVKFTSVAEMLAVARPAPAAGGRWALSRRR